MIQCMSEGRGGRRENAGRPADGHVRVKRTYVLREGDLDVIRLHMDREGIKFPSQALQDILQRCGETLSA